MRLLLTNRKKTALEAAPGAVAQHGLAECEGIAPMAVVTVRLYLKATSKVMSCNDQKSGDREIVGPKSYLAEAAGTPVNGFCLLASLEPDRLIGAIPLQVR